MCADFWKWVLQFSKVVCCRYIKLVKKGVILINNRAIDAVDDQEFNFYKSVKNPFPRNAAHIALYLKRQISLSYPVADSAPSFWKAIE